MSGPLAGSAPLTSAQSALQRLATSRAHLGTAMGRQAPTSASGQPQWPSSGPLASLASQGILSALAERWRQSNWHLSLQVADQAADSLLRPVAQRHPVGLVLAAGAAGGLLALVRPWRWVPARSLLALSPLIGRAIAKSALQGTAWPGPRAGQAVDQRAP